MSGTIIINSTDILNAIKPQLLQMAEITLQPYSYVIYTDGTTIYAKNGATGSIDFSGTDASEVIQNAVNSVITGKIYVKRGTYALTKGIVIERKHVVIECEPGTVFKAEADIAMFTFKYTLYPRWAGLVGAHLDMNQVASVGLLLENAIYTYNDVYVNNVGTGTAVKILTTDENWNSMTNWVRARVEGNNRATGSIGILIDSTVAERSNFNWIEAKVVACDVGIKVVKGRGNVFYNTEVDLCNIAFDIGDMYTLIIGGFEEGNVNHGVIVRSGASAFAMFTRLEKYTTQ